MSFSIHSSVFSQGQTIPKPYTGDGGDVSPPLAWTDPPEGTKSLALICDDPDAPSNTFTHWILFNIPSSVRELPEGAGTAGKPPEGASPGTNDFGNVRYGGPAPPPGAPHRYFFRLFALDDRLNLKPRAIRSELLSAMRNHILAETELMGMYGR
jgi:Raf kinase inhibitor-like YbhB/YbcL family protein